MVVSSNAEIFGYSNNFFEINDFIKIAAGLWRPGSDKPLWLRLPYFLYIGFMYFNGFVYNFCQYLIFNEMLQNIPKLLSYIGMCLTLTLGMVKLGIFVFAQKRVDKILSDLQHNDFKYVSLDENGPSTMFSKEKLSSSRTAFLVNIYTKENLIVFF